MANFFQRLTGSLKMPNDEELFDDKGAITPKMDDTPSTAAAHDSQLTVAGEPGGETREPGAGEELDGDQHDVELPSDADTRDEKDEERGEEGEDEEKGEGGEGELLEELEGPIQEDEDGARPYAIAQLAKAQTQTKKRSLFKNRLPVLHPKKEDVAEERASNIPEGQLAIDVYETPTHILVKSTIAGVKPQDLDIGIEDNTLNVRGSRHQEEKIKGEDYFYQECYWGTFSRSVILPMEVDAENVEASLKDGILTVRLPKIVKEKEKKIRVMTE